MAGTDFDMFDAEFATRQFSGNHALLIQILDKFIAQHQDFDNELTQQLRVNDFDAVKHNVHTLKGVSGNLGMTALYNECKVFEQHLATEQISDEQRDMLLHTFKQTLSVVKAFNEQGSAPMAPEEKASNSEKSNLIAALKGNEFISDGKMQSYLASLDLAPNVQEQLQQAIHDLDYPKAIQLLE